MYRFIKLMELTENISIPFRQHYTAQLGVKHKSRVLLKIKKKVVGIFKKL